MKPLPLIFLAATLAALSLSAQTSALKPDPARAGYEMVHGRGVRDIPALGRVFHRRRPLDGKGAD